MKHIRLATCLALAAFALVASAQQPARKPYIVQLTDAPAAAYDGRVPGYRATRPPTGSRLNVNAGDVQAYLGYLAARQASAEAVVVGAPVTYRYKVVLNGFATWLTDAEVVKLAANAGVKSISRRRRDAARHGDHAHVPRHQPARRRVVANRRGRPPDQGRRRHHRPRRRRRLAREPFVLRQGRRRRQPDRVASSGHRRLRSAARRPLRRHLPAGARLQRGPLQQTS